MFDNWSGLLQSMREFADRLNGLPELLRECGIATHILERRRPEIERLAKELRALKDF